MKTYGIIEIKDKVHSAYKGQMFKGFGIYILYKFYENFFCFILYHLIPQLF